ncbi:hypothetical protein MCOR31_011929 [Pyricularia oryzae]|nr:hypothetical protein MCOR31_011929 [Pyricularia oryzae]
MPSLKTVILGFMAASITLAGPIPIVRPGSVDMQRTVRARDGNTADPISESLEVPVMGEQDQPEHDHPLEEKNAEGAEGQRHQHQPD